MEITVTSALPCDAAQIEEIEALSFGDPWSLTAVESELDRSGSLILKAVSKGENTILGYIIGVSDDESAYIEKIAVLPKYRRSGVGEALIIGFIDRVHCPIISLDVRRSNTSAFAFYERLGFKSAAVRRRMYDNPKDDGITMIMELNL